MKQDNETIDLKIMVIDEIHLVDMTFRNVKNFNIGFFNISEVFCKSFIEILFSNVNCYSNPPTKLMNVLLNLDNLLLFKFSSSLTI
jgi:hypothetical protein